MSDSGRKRTALLVGLFQAALRAHADDPQPLRSSAAHTEAGEEDENPFAVAFLPLVERASVATRQAAARRPPSHPDGPGRDPRRRHR